MSKLGSPKRKKINKILKIDNDAVDIPSLNTFVKEETIEVEDIIEDQELENELISYQYIPLSTIIIKNDNGMFLHKYIKAVNRMGQKVYILIDGDTKKNINPDLTLIDNKEGNVLPYSLKSGVMKMAGMDTSGVAIECDQNGLCMLTNDINEEDDNLSIIESNFTFKEQPSTGSVVENYGCHMSYPVVKLSEIKVNNDIVVEGTNNVTRKLRNSSYTTYLEEMKNVICSVQALEESQNTLLNLFENNALTLNDSLDQLEEWNDYYTTNKPTAECDIKKQNLIIHNMRIRNDYISYLICGMKRIADTQKQIDKLNNNVNEYIEFFQDQFKDLDRANKII